MVIGCSNKAPVLLALGGARSLWDDIKAALALIAGRVFHAAACNDAISHYEGELEFAASLHPEKMPEWLRTRKDNGGNMDFPVICNKARNGYYPDRVIQERWSGSSGLFVIQAAVTLFNYDRVICCGIPLDHGQGHYFDSKGRWSHAHSYYRGWKEAMHSSLMVGKVRSVSGWTKDLLGLPDNRWLDGGN